MSFRPKTVHVVSHTHWDREWYNTYHTFRVQLVRVVQRILEALEGDPDFEHFLLDGQTIVLEDYLEACPQDEGRIRALVEKGALSIGPWYMLPDELLVSAESHVRNLLVGHAVGRRFGGVQKVGYMPDSFGHIAQMPQLLRLAQLDAFVYTRGNGDEIEETGHEFQWEAPDGSRVLAVNQCNGYCNGAALGFDELWHAHTCRVPRPERAVEQVAELFEAMAERSRGEVVLLNNGCDHFPPQQEFGRILGALREAFPETRFVHSDLPSFLEEVRDAGFATRTYRGELIAGKLHPVLSGVWSARMPLKQRNEACQTLLAGSLEPFCAYTHFALGRDYPSGLLEYAWKLLLANHPHDSICGCSTDEVHRDMLPRFEGVRQTAEQVLAGELQQLAPTFARRAEDDAATVLCLANPLPERRRELVDRLVILQPPGADPARLRLLDERGREVAMRVVDSWTVERFWGVDYRTQLAFEQQERKFRGYREDFGQRILRPAEELELSDTFLHVQFLADLPALGHVCLRLQEGETSVDTEDPPRSVRASGDLIENELVRVRLHPNGSFDLEHLPTGRRWSALNLLEDVEDVGDEYDYSPCEESRVLDASGVEGELAVVEDTGFAATLELGFDLHLPRAIAADRKARSAELVACRTLVRLRLRAASPLVEVDLSFDNQARDHRLRALFPGLAHSDSIVSDGHFYTNARPLEPPKGEDWWQPHSGTYPQQDFSLVADAQGGVAVLNRGLPEIAPLRAADGRAGIALTLLRSVGWLSRDDFPTRRSQNAGPTVATPEAQCLGPQRFRYAVLPFEGDWLEARVKSASQRYRVPPLIVQGVEDQMTQGGTSFLERTTARTCVTAVKKHEERDTLVVRLHNLTGEEVVETLRFGREIAQAWRTDLLEERLEELQLASAHELCLTLRGYEIATVEVG
jgi:alpha-mannosidase